MENKNIQTCEVGCVTGCKHKQLGRKQKYATEEERLKARREQKINLENKTIT